MEKLEKDKSARLKFENLGHLEDGAVVEEIDAAIAQMLRDCEQRPALEAVRELPLALVMKPIFNAKTRQIDGIEFGVVIKQPKLPPTKSRAEIMRTVPITNGDGVIVGLDALFEDVWQPRLDLSLDGNVPAPVDERHN
jgi:hypothetical protein